MAADPTGLNAVVRESLDRHLGDIEKSMDRDAVAVYGPIVSGLDLGVRDAIEAIEDRRANKQVAVILDTPGGSAEVVERMVDTIRSFYDDVAFMIPDRAMSAGTIFAMSGDAIYMDYFSRLGPIDPQIWKEDRFVPALSYLAQYKRLLDKDRNGELTNAEFALLSKFDLAELHQFEQAHALSITLLKKWLANYKFKNWRTTQTSGREVTQRDRIQRAEDIAKALSNNELWHSHGRGISRSVLESDDIKLKIDDLGAFPKADPNHPDLKSSVRKYHHCLSDFMRTVKAGIFVHSRAYF